MEVRTDFTKYRFRPHALHHIMTGINAVGLTEKQEQLFNDFHYRHTNPEAKPLTKNQQETYADLLKKKNAKPTLSKTTKTYLNNLHKSVLWKREKKISSQYLEKGIVREEVSFTLMSKYFNTLFIKNKERKRNDWFTGECDNIRDGIITDVKSSWELDTFPMYDLVLPDSNYDWQQQAYMDLWEVDQARVAYCLVDTPTKIVEDHLRRLDWKMSIMDGMGNIHPDKKDLVVETISNHIYTQSGLEQFLSESSIITEESWFDGFIEIPIDLRVRVFDIKRDEKKLEAIKNQIVLAREYLNSLSVITLERLKAAA